MFTPRSVGRDALRAGEVGFVIAGVKEIGRPRWATPSRIANKPAEAPLPGFKEIKPQVFAGLYPGGIFRVRPTARLARKLRLNDSSLQFEPEVSQALGFGFRCGFLGLLHMDIVQERLEREFDMDLITTAPTVVYEVVLNDNSIIPHRQSGQAAGARQVPGDPRADHHRDHFPAAGLRRQPVITLCNQKRGNQIDMRYHGRQVQLIYEMPMNEVVMDFFDRLKLKSVSRGYASLDYEFREYRTSDLVKSTS